MTTATFRIIRAYTPAAFRFVMVALSMACIFQGAIALAAALNTGAPQ